MSVGVSRGLELQRRRRVPNTNPGKRGLVSLGEESSTDDLAVTVVGPEFLTHFARSFPTLGNWAEILVGEGPALRPYPGVEESDDDVGSVIGLRPQPALYSESEELWGPGGVELTRAVFEDGEDRRAVLETVRLCSG